LQTLEDALVRHATRQAERSGRRISCRAGCGACCRQLVPVSEAEARRLAELVSGLPDAERTAVEERFARALEALSSNGLLDRLREPGTILDRAERRRVGLEYFSRGVACPFLVSESCSIHRDRPLACREYLVTSPAQYCADPTPETVDQVELPKRLSRALMRFASEDQTTPRWVPLVLALESGQGTTEPRPTRPGPELLRAFIALAFEE
jgi:Fe-S-cluster containining protein